MHMYSTVEVFYFANRNFGEMSSIQSFCNIYNGYQWYIIVPLPTPPLSVDVEVEASVGCAIVYLCDDAAYIK